MSQPNLITDLKIPVEINLYYDFYKPEKAEKPSPLLIAVHGYGAHKHYMMREARQIASPEFAIVSIQAPYQHYRETDKGYKVGFGWLTDYKSDESIALHHDFILRIIEKLANESEINFSEIYLFGFSQACALNFRFAFTHPDLLRGVLGVCGGIPSDLEENSIYHPTRSDVFYLYSRNDEFYPLEKFQAFDDKLRDYLPNYQSQSYNAKHEITNDMREDMREWLKNR